MIVCLCCNSPLLIYTRLSQSKIIIKIFFTEIIRQTFKLKHKSSLLVQIMDLFNWASNQPNQSFCSTCLIQGGKLDAQKRLGAQVSTHLMACVTNKIIHICDSHRPLIFVTVMKNQITKQWEETQIYFTKHKYTRFSIQIQKINKSVGVFIIILII